MTREEYDRFKEELRTLGNKYGVTLVARPLPTEYDPRPPCLPLFPFIVGFALYEAPETHPREYREAGKP